MRKTKFWLIQIVMLVMLSLVFGSPVFSGPPDHAKGVGAETSRTAHNNHSDGNAKAEGHANENAAFYVETSPPPPPPPGDEETCTGTWWNGECIG